MYICTTLAMVLCLVGITFRYKAEPSEEDKTGVCSFALYKFDLDIATLRIRAFPVKLNRFVADLPLPLSIAVNHSVAGHDFELLAMCRHAQRHKTKNLARAFRGALRTFLLKHTVDPAVSHQSCGMQPQFIVAEKIRHTQRRNRAAPLLPRDSSFSPSLVSLSDPLQISYRRNCHSHREIRCTPLSEFGSLPLSKTRRHLF